MSFENLNLSQPILRALTKCGYTQPTPIQQQAIPRALAGKDLIANAQTGTGKTAAFVLPALEKLATIRQTTPSILILTPTRELANQITTAVYKYGSHLRVKVVSILGGMPYHSQLRQLSQPVDIIVATPGRLIDYIKRGNIDLSQIQMLILDEADRMLDMGFIDDVKYIASCISTKRQTLLFTATIDEKITKLAHTILNTPERITIPGETVTLKNIQQQLYIVDDKNHKNRLLEHLLSEENIYKAIIFSATKHHADVLSRQLRDWGYNTGALHGDMNQRKRNHVINQFRTEQLQILVATDVAARGIDINDITHVINYDIPRAAEDYIHRIGRTGRAGKQGIAISFVAANEGMQLKRIERYTGSNITQHKIAGLEPKQSLKSAAPNKPKRNWHHKKRKNFSANVNTRNDRNFHHHNKKANNYKKRDK